MSRIWIPGDHKVRWDCDIDSFRFHPVPNWVCSINGRPLEFRGMLATWTMRDMVADLSQAKEMTASHLIAWPYKDKDGYVWAYLRAQKELTKVFGFNPMPEDPFKVNWMERGY